MTATIDFVAREPWTIQAPAGITETYWIPVAPSGLGEGAGTVFCPGSVDREFLRSSASRQAHRTRWVPDLWSLLRLEPGWDSYGASAVEAHAVVAALAFLGRLPLQSAPSLVPTSRGGIQLEWHTGGVDVEIECLPNGQAILSAEDARTQESVERSVVPGHPAIEDWMRRLEARGRPAKTK